MSENEGRATAPGVEQEEAGELSPPEKLEAQPTTRHLPPGVEDPYNEGPKQERSAHPEVPAADRQPRPSNWSRAAGLKTLRRGSPCLSHGEHCAADERRCRI